MTGRGWHAIQMSPLEFARVPFTPKEQIVDSWADIKRKQDRIKAIKEQYLKSKPT